MKTPSKTNTGLRVLFSLPGFSQYKKQFCHLGLILVCIYITTINVFLHDDRNKLDSYDGSHQWLSGETVKYVNNWLIDGAVHDKFTMYEDYSSVEFQRYEREHYVSYPPGAVLPVYVAAKILHKDRISIGFVKRFVRTEFFLSILVLGLFFYVFLLKIGVTTDISLIALPVSLSIIWAYLPFNHYYLQNVYFSDQAIILLSLLFFLNELLFFTSEKNNTRRVYQWISFFLVLYGSLTDYYFFVLVFTAFILRLSFSRQHWMGLRKPWPVMRYFFSKNIDLIAGILVCLMLFLIQLQCINGGFATLYERFNIRTSFSSADKEIQFGFIKGIGFLYARFSEAFFPNSAILFFITLIFCMASFFPAQQHPAGRRLVFMLSLATFSSVFHTSLLFNHSVIHAFSLLKYNFLFVLILFFGICRFFLLKPGLPFVKKHFSLQPGYIMIPVFIFYFTCLVNKKDIFYKSNTGVDLEKNKSRDLFVKRNSTYQDVIFSPDAAVDILPPFDISFTEKRIYNVSEISRINEKPIPPEAIINILISDSTVAAPGWSLLKPFLGNAAKEDNYYLVKFKQPEFKKMVH